MFLRMCLRNAKKNHGEDYMDKQKIGDNMTTHTDPG